MIESLLTLFVKQIEVGFRYAVVTVHMPLCLVPDILDPVDMVFLFGDDLAKLMELMGSAGSSIHGPTARGVRQTGDRLLHLLQPPADHRQCHPLPRQQ
jgi:hypothetical protein